MTNSSRQAQDDVEQARQQISETVDELRRKLAPGELFNEVKSHLMSTNGSRQLSQTASQVSQQVQENPLAVLLVGAGLAWLMTGSRGRAHGDGSTALSAAGEAVSGGLADVRSHTSHAIDRGGERADTALRHMRGTTAEMIERYPLAAGAAALALGVVLGAALPSTQIEDRQLGETADTLMESARARARDALAEGEDVAAKAAETAVSEAERRGLIADDPDSPGGRSGSPRHG